MFGFISDTLPFLLRTAGRYGPISSFRVLNQRIYLIDDAGLIEDILMSRQHEFVRDTGATLLRELVGDGLLTRDEPAHKERRRALQPAFHRAQVSGYGRVMTATILKAAGAWTAGSRIELTAEMRKLTLLVVGAALFGADFGESAQQIERVLGKVIRKSRVIAPGLALFEPLAKAYRRLFANGPSLCFGRERAALEIILQPAIERRRSERQGDIVSLLLEQLGDRDAANEIVTLVLAGHETTSVALTWAWILLSAHPDAERRFHSEIDTALNGREATAEDLPVLPYTAWVFAEAMRLYPPAPVFGRRPLRKVALGGYEVPPGSSILLSPYITHRNARYFDEAKEFRPERWKDLAVPKFAYFPFGGGAKMCIGDAFARMEGSLALASIGQRWRLVADEPEKATAAPGLTLRPAAPVWMTLERRSR